MSQLRYTLLSDGSSNRALLPILTWLLRQNAPGYAIQPAWSDLRRLLSLPRGLADRVDLALELYPCEVLFVHRDAEREPREQRVREIQQAIAASERPDFPAISVIPIRMTEAWLLFDEAAIRGAAGNPNGRAPLDLPRLRDVERIPDPKQVLYDLLRQACELTGRRLKKLNLPRSALRVADQISDFSPLRELSAFEALERDCQQTIRERGW